MKITRAMELIATSRILKAQQRVEAARPYAERLTAAITDVASASAALRHPLLEERPEPKAAAGFVVTSDRGLAGAYSSNVLRRGPGPVSPRPPGRPEGKRFSSRRQRL